MGTFFDIAVSVFLVAVLWGIASYYFSIQWADQQKRKAEFKRRKEEFYKNNK